MYTTRWAGALFGLSLTLGASPQALADNTSAASPSAADTTTELAEVTVTAEKRSENLQKAPTTISVVSGADLAIQGINDISEATAVFPSVKFGQISGTVHLYIRGIGAEQDRASIDPLSAMTQNGINLPREITGNNLFDIGSVQVLPGPQSTLYSTSAAGGIVAVTDNRPTHVQEGSVMLEAGNYDMKHVTAVENMPLSDTLAIRGAFDAMYHDGYETSGADSEDQIGLRVSALFTPNDDFTGYAWYAYNHTGGQPANTVTLTANHTFADTKNAWNDQSCAPRAQAHRWARIPSAIPSGSAPPRRTSAPTCSAGSSTITFPAPPSA